jgi:hypothetical protein
MKKIIILILAILSIGTIFAQTDKNGSPIFNSVSTNEKTIDNFTLISNYYTLRNNIENKLSSVYVTEKPTLDQIENAAIHLVSDFYILTKESKMVVMVLLQNEPKRAFMTINMGTKEKEVFPCNLSGDITENRAEEIIKEKYDPNATIENGKLKFNGKEFIIIANQELEDAIWSLIKKEKLDKKKPSKIILPSKNELKNFILTESKEGGKLDFFTEIKGKEYDGVQIKPGVFTTKVSIALYQWGRACFDIGVNTIEDVYAIYSEFKQKELNQREKEYIKLGFEKDWEK